MEEWVRPLFGIAIIIAVAIGAIALHFKRGRQFKALIAALDGKKVRGFFHTGIQFTAAGGRVFRMWVREKKRTSLGRMIFKLEAAPAFKFRLRPRAKWYQRDLETLFQFSLLPAPLPADQSALFDLRADDPVRAQFHFQDPKRFEAAAKLMTWGFSRVEGNGKVVTGTMLDFKDTDFSPEAIALYTELLANLV